MTPTSSGDGGAMTTAEILEELLLVPGIDMALLVGRDGFVIHAAGTRRGLELEALSATLAHALNGLESMGRELELETDGIQDMYVQYGRAMLTCTPVGGAVLVIVSPDAATLGIIRHKVRRAIAALENVL